jgi:hypothetical protein
MSASFLTRPVPPILICTVLAMILVLIITFYVESAKKKMGANLIYLFISGIFLGIVGIRANTWLGNIFYVYLVVLIWNLIAGILHIFLSKKILEWPATEPIGWRFLYALAIVFVGFSMLLTFMAIDKYSYKNWYNISAVLTFFIPLFLVYAYECYLLIPPRIYLPQKPWMYFKSSTLSIDPSEVIVILKYRLTSETGKEVIDSQPMRAPASIKLGDFFNATLECYKVTQGRHNIEVRDRSNNYLGWFFFLSDGRTVGKILDPNKSLIELGFTNTHVFGPSTIEEIEYVTNQKDREGQSYIIVCKREHEYKSQLMRV